MMYKLALGICCLFAQLAYAAWEEPKCGGRAADDSRTCHTYTIGQLEWGDWGANLVYQCQNKQRAWLYIIFNAHTADAGVETLKVRYAGKQDTHDMPVHVSKRPNPGRGNQYIFTFQQPAEIFQALMRHSYISAYIPAIKFERPLWVKFGMQHSRERILATIKECEKL